MKARTNVSIDKKILEAAKVHNIVLSPLLEEAVKNELAKLEEKAWREENKNSISSYNKHIAHNGVFSDGMRTF